MSDKQEYSEEYKKLLKYINDTPELLSTLYDWDLLPEQVQPKTERCNMMIQFVVWYREVYSKRIAELEAELAEVKPKWQCKAKSAFSSDPPQECDWPFCGCDPKADDVIESLQECGWASFEEVCETEREHKSELAEAKKDSERLDWLVESGCVVIPSGEGWLAFKAGVFNDFFGTTFREAIDLARGANAQPPTKERG